MTATDPISAAVQSRPPRRPQAPAKRRFKFFRVTLALMLREIASRDSRVALGFLWQVLEPVASIILMTLVFRLMTRNPPLGTNFPLYYVTGVLPFQVFMVVSNRVSSAVRFSRPLLEFPAVHIIDALAARFLLNFVIEVSVFLMLVFVIIWSYDLKITVDIPMAAQSLCLAAVLALGIGCFNSVLFVAFPTYEMAYGVVTRPLMLVSGVLFQVDAMPTMVRDWILWNPVAHVVALMRGAFYAGADISFVSEPYVLAVSGITMTIGLVTLHSFFRDALER